MSKFNTIEEAIEDIRAGKMIIVVDDEDRENEGDLLMAAEKVTPEAVNFMAKYGRGLICMPIVAQRLKELDIPQMVAQNTDIHQTAFTVSIDAVDTTTGISAFERAHTIKKVLDPKATPEDFRKPGHIFPLQAREGGVLKRAGHTEAAVDFAKLAGLAPAGVICEIMNEDGTMARVPQLLEFAKKHGLKIVTVADLIAYRRRTEILVEKVAQAELPTKYGHFRIIGYQNKLNGEHHVALVKGNIQD
ncbi:MAG TPA: 3,4-dihydroxy-2-butanone-4-phosphate synthase, partial [Clostridiales bacterium]|nr:3,4-dihydroxy-2-butanone-4-phosphate synthase [Clostridiales bacterium]